MLTQRIEEIRYKKNKSNNQQQPQEVAKICPLCKKENNCMAGSGEKCWCENIDIPNGLLMRVRKLGSINACICIKCIESYKKGEKSPNQISLH